MTSESDSPISFSSRSRRRVIVRTMLVVSDAVALLAAGFFATVIRFGQWRHIAAIGPPGSTVTFARVAILMAVVWLLALWFERLYQRDRVLHGSEEFGRVLRAVVMGTAGFIIIQYLLKVPGLSRLWMLLVTAFAAVFVVLGRALVRAAIQVARRRGLLLRTALIAGDNEEAVAIIGVLFKNRRAGLVPVGCLGSSRANERGVNDCGGRVALLGDAGEIRRVVAEHSIDTVVIASSAYEPALLSRLITDLRGWDGDIQVSAGLADVATARVFVHEVAGIPLIAVRGVAFTPLRRLSKRVLDVAVAGLAILLGLPVWLCIAAAVKISSPGPVFYRQPRVGRGGEAFQILKFRSMRTDTQLAPVPAGSSAVSAHILKMKDDPRVTSVGRVLRRFSLDEFPQLLNVLRGEMSLVGPRPEQACEVECYEEDQRRRLDVAPGLTGLWQVSGRSDLSVDDKMRLDLYYVENWSLAGDVAILFRTVPVVLLAKGAY